MESESNLDIETNGLLHNVSTIHRLAIHDLEQVKRLRTMTQEMVSRFQEACKDSRTRTALLVTTLLATTYLLFANFTIGLISLTIWLILYYLADSITQT